MAANKHGKSLLASEFSYLSARHLADDFGPGLVDDGAMTKTPTQPGYSALRRGRCTVPGQIYLLTFCTTRRCSWFGAPTLAAIAAGVCSDPESWPHANPLLWLLMPDHWHGVVQITGTERLGVTVARLKGRMALAVAAHTGPRLWQRGYHDHALRAEEQLEDVVAYVLDNPVRKGLVDHWPEWPFRGGTLNIIP